MEVIGALPAARSIAVLAGSFHPVTRAHIALARSALRICRAVLFVMPRRFPHKDYEGVGLAGRIEILRAAAQGEPRFAIAITEGGLFREIAAEIGASVNAELASANTQLWFVCGRDAAERIVAWDYGAGPGIAEQLRDFGLLVADRMGSYAAPPDLAERIRPLPLPVEYQEMSSTEVRRRLAAGGRWEELVPEAAWEPVARLYL